MEYSGVGRRGILLLLVILAALALVVSPARADDHFDESIGEAFARIGFNVHDTNLIIGRSWTVANPAMFKYAAALDTPTITPEEAPWAVPVRIGISQVTWPDQSLIPDFPAETDIVDGSLYLPRGEVIVPDTPYMVMWAQMRGPVELADPLNLFQNWSFPVFAPGSPTWVPHQQFPYDTWGGASIIPYITYRPNPWSIRISQVEDGSLLDVPFNGFGLISGDTIIVGVESSTFLPDGLDGVTYGFAGHIHDGTYGSQPTSSSLITFATGLPGNLYPAVSSEPLQVGSQPPPVTTTTTTTTPTTTTTTSSTVTPPAAAPEQPATTGGFPWLEIFLGLLGVIVVIIGGRWFLATNRDPCADLLVAWQTAQRACDEARATEDKARAECEKASGETTDLEREQRNLCAEWPPACEGESSSWAEESGKPDSRVTGSDLHARRVALGRLWDEYQAGNISAQQVEDAWKHADTPQFREEMRRKTAEKKAEKARLDQGIEEARGKERDACDRHAIAREKADEACAEAANSRRAYKECVEEQNAAAFVDAVMGLGSETAPTSVADSTGPASVSGLPTAVTATADDDPFADRRVDVSVPITIDKTGLSGTEAERARRLERIFLSRRGTCDIAGVALDLYQFNHWHQENFGEPWYTWSTGERSAGAVTSTTSVSETFMQTRVMACYEFVHFCAYICSDQLGTQRIGGDDDKDELLDEYSVNWGFPDKINTNTSPISGEAPRGSVVTGEFRWGYNNSAGYYHTGISIGDGKIISLGADGLLLEDVTGYVGGCFPSVGYSEVLVGDYAYSNTNPPPAAKGN